MINSSSQNENCPNYYPLVPILMLHAAKSAAEKDEDLATRHSVIEDLAYWSSWLRMPLVLKYVRVTVQKTRDVMPTYARW